MSEPRKLGLFEAYGVEIEYMLVDRDTLDVMPAADRLLQAQAGELSGDADGLDGIAWSNEIVLHLIEFKTDGPSPRLAGLADRFQRNVKRANELLNSLGARLMPSAAHPWMDPHRETMLWPHENNEIYRAYDRIFGCRGHGWVNLQSLHINLPFEGDEEFARLHAAVRVLLPIMPALTASSPVLDLRPTGMLDTRMEYYRTNSGRIPSVTGQVIPEPAFSRDSYEELIYRRMMLDIAPLDPEGILRREFLNSRGAIARFDRGSIEVRVLDNQECPRADLALTALISSALKKLAEGDWVPIEEQKRQEVGPLAGIFLDVIRDAQSGRIADRAYLSMFGLSGRESLSAGELWEHIAGACLDGFEHDPAWDKPLSTVLEKGCLARRILASLDGDFRKERVKETYLRLCDCLERGEVFDE